ncbi:MAG: hypothetical protein MJ009_07905 [Paludibacteraceae bacterium]|nr:hypothetical protein [Paludibacteraceae bacterium]
MNRKILLMILLIPCALLCAQSYFYVYYSDGRTVQYDSETADSINFISSKNEMGVVKSGDTIARFTAVNLDSVSVYAPESVVERCSADMYEQVTIGEQTWMAENYRCAMYDTESEAYRAGIYTVTAYSQDEDAFAPYFMQSRTEDPTAYGYYYNWAAAVGVADGKSQTTEFSGHRQGICPNGWHLPSESDWNALRNFIEVTDHQGENTAGVHLKSTDGWRGTKEHIDSYGFAALPAGGYTNGVKVGYVGYKADMWTSLTDAENEAYAMNLSYDANALNSGKINKSDGRSVRCIKTQLPPPTTGEADRKEGTGTVKVKWVQLWENGPKFAEYNVGATSVGDYGGYYCWGSTLDQDHNTWYWTGTEDIQYGDYDTAKNLWGNNWQMPTKEDLDNLINPDNCDITEYFEDSKYGDKNGILFTGKGDYAENSVFFPAAGMFFRAGVAYADSYGLYWSSTSEGNDELSYGLGFYLGLQSVSTSNRDGGMSVRAILKE